MKNDIDISTCAMPTKGGAARTNAALGRIDQYKLVSKLGEGGLGAVYLVRDSVSGFLFAIKSVHPLFKTSPDELQNLKDNFALIAKLSHPNIATASVLHKANEVVFFNEATRRDFPVSSGDLVMVMTYAPGVTLSVWSKQFPGKVVPPQIALDIVWQLAQAIDYAHSKKILHCDIKPSNVMIETREDGTVRARILEFGFASEIRALMCRVSRDIGDTLGSRHYMSPEQWTERQQSAATDQYALAVLFYELVSGAVPFATAFETGDVVQMMNAVKNELPESLDCLSLNQNAALLKALSKDPHDRYANCCEFVTALLDGLAASKTDATLVEIGCPLCGTKCEVTPDEIGRKAECEVCHSKFIISCDKFPPPELQSRREELITRKKLCIAIVANIVALSLLVGALAWKRHRDSELCERHEMIPQQQEDERQQEEEQPLPEPQQPQDNVMPPQERKAGDEKTITLPGGTEMTFCWCPPGEFMMGSNNGDDDEKPVHCVKLTKGFWMGKTEVSQRQWTSVMGDNPSHFKGDELPVENVSWNDCQTFIKNVKDYTGLDVSLPTEAQWEYACRAGTTGDCAGKLDDMGWHRGNSGLKTHHVATKMANKWGLYDMHANVMEWCQDWYKGSYSSDDAIDPTGPASGSHRVLRSSGWYFNAHHCRSADRAWDRPHRRSNRVGFRVALMPSSD